MEEKMAILVLGRDQTSKLVYLTSYFMDKYWSDRKFRLVLCTQTSVPGGVNYDQVICAGAETVWSDRLKIAVKAIQAEYILFTSEDFFLKDFVEPGLMESYLEKMDSEKIVSAIKLTPSKNFIEKYDDQYNCIKKGAPYRVCVQPTIFKRDYLLALAEKNYTPWQFEVDGSEYSSLLEGEVLVVRKNEYNCVHAWGKGAWTREAVSLFKKEKIDRRLYENDPIYPILRYIVDFVWSIVFRWFPHFFTDYSKKKNRQN
jgi:hypothetical protein